MGTVRKILGDKLFNETSVSRFTQKIGKKDNRIINDLGKLFLLKSGLELTPKQKKAKSKAKRAKKAKRLFNV